MTSTIISAQIKLALALHFARVHFRFVRWPRRAHGRRRKPVRPRIRFARRLDFLRRRARVSRASRRAARRVQRLSAITSSQLVYRLDLFDLRRVPAGAVQLPRRDAAAAARTRIFLAFPFRPPPGLVASLTLLIIHFNEKEKSLGHWNYLIAARARFSVGDDGQHRALSEFQIARPAFDHDVSEVDHRRAVRRLHFDFARKNSLLRPARVFHRLSDLRLCASEPLARLAPGN